MDWITRLDSPVGELTLASDGTALTGLWIAGQKYHSLGLEPGAREARLPVFEAAAGWLESYFAGERPDPGPRSPRAAVSSGSASGGSCWIYQAESSRPTETSPAGWALRRGRWAAPWVTTPFL